VREQLLFDPAPGILIGVHFGVGRRGACVDVHVLVVGNAAAAAAV